MIFRVDRIHSCLDGRTSRSALTEAERRRMEELESGIEGSLPPGPGVHDYAFVVDEQRWIADPQAIPVDDGFGGINSRVALLLPESSDAHRGRSS